MSFMRCISVHRFRLDVPHFFCFKLFNGEINRETYNILHIHNFTPQETPKIQGKI